ncbi:hypothetical protein SAMN05443432_1193 [Roseovarius litoreus]|uniref:Outer membrane protein beta-barrel domain-containing protein n=1 Tax=Roseovarius litoreus TaxID=1155722 RepID=A0A1M7LN95_9RHOB|nr:hypothetical protein [Roseovarius litoreus]SHM79666.1 hypothetical protein SAMN05443432_1193 [Roseovarius litoreus]
MPFDSLARARSIVAAGLICVGTFLAPNGAKADPSDWSGQVTVYGWGAGVSGDFRPLPIAPRLSFDNSFSDVLEDLDAAFFMTALARRGDLVLFGDLTYSSSSRSGRVPPGIAASGELTMRSATLAAGKRFHAERQTTLDLLGGARFWSINGLVSVPLAGVSVAPEANFADPIIALRANTRLSPRWSLLAYVDAGGFGTGSDFTWQTAVTANYKVSDRFYLSAGWRHLYVDYNKNGADFDGSMTGPLIGATIRF